MATIDVEVHTTIDRPREEVAALIRWHQVPYFLIDRGEVTSQTSPTGDVFKATYAAKGNQLSVTDGHGTTTSYTYQAGPRPSTATPSPSPAPTAPTSRNPWVPGAGAGSLRDDRSAVERQQTRRTS